MSKYKINNTCPGCGAVDSYEEGKGFLASGWMVCKECGYKISPEKLEEHKYKDFNNLQPANPRCPNVKCAFHKEPPSAKKAFIISVVEEGLMGKIFKSEAYGIVSCKLCGEVIGVGGKG